MYKNIEEVAKGNIHECIVNEFEHCVKETKHWYDKKHHQDVSSYPVDNFRILASPATHTSNILRG